MPHRFSVTKFFPLIAGHGATYVAQWRNVIHVAQQG